MFYMEGLSSAEIWKKEKNIKSLKIRKLNITRVHDITRYCPFKKLHKLHLTSHSTCSLVIVCFGRPPLFCWAAMGKLNLMAKLGISGLFGRPLTFLAAFFMISSLEFFIFTGFWNMLPVIPLELFHLWVFSMVFFSSFLSLISAVVSVCSPFSLVSFL